MQTKYRMPADVRRTAIELVRGYKRRLELYRELRYNIIHGGPMPKDRPFSGASVLGDPTASKALKLEALEAFVEVRRMRAVEQAKLRIGLDILDEGIRQALIEAIWDSCIEGRNFTFEYRALPLGKTNFYDRRNKFLSEIAHDTDFL